MSQNSAQTPVFPTQWSFKIIGFFMSIALMVSSFFLKSAWDKISELERDVHTLEIQLTERTAGRFDTSDWMREKIILEAKISSMDSRLIRLEENIPFIKESLDDIKQSFSGK